MCEGEGVAGQEVMTDDQIEQAAIVAARILADCGEELGPPESVLRRSEYSAELRGKIAGAVLALRWAASAVAEDARVVSSAYSGSLLGSLIGGADAAARGVVTRFLARFGPEPLPADVDPAAPGEVLMPDTSEEVRRAAEYVASAAPRPSEQWELLMRPVLESRGRRWVPRASAEAFVRYVARSAPGPGCDSHRCYAAAFLAGRLGRSLAQRDAAPTGADVTLSLARSHFYEVAALARREQTARPMAAHDSLRSAVCDVKERASSLRVSLTLKASVAAWLARELSGGQTSSSKAFQAARSIENQLAMSGAGVADTERGDEHE